MIFLILGLLVCVALAAVVVALVAVPARREGRELLTPKGEEVVGAVRDRTGRAVDAARSRAGALGETARGSSAKDDAAPSGSEPGTADEGSGDEDAPGRASETTDHGSDTGDSQESPEDDSDSPVHRAG